MLRDGASYDRSAAERLARSLCHEAQLPQPLVNRPLHGFLVDFLWPEAMLVLEVDGYATHSGRRAVERDRRRDQVLVPAGFVVIRVT